MFETARLRLRAYEDADFDTYHAWWNDPAMAIWQTTGPVRPITREASAATLKSWIKDSLIYCCLETLSERTLIGMVNLWGIDPKNRSCHLAIMIGRPFWSQGYGREALTFLIRYAFAELGVHRIALQVAAINDRATACYRAVGFREEGRLRQATWQFGAWQDELLMALLEEDLPPVSLPASA